MCHILQAVGEKVLQLVIPGKGVDSKEDRGVKSQSFFTELTLPIGSTSCPSIWSPQ